MKLAPSARTRDSLTIRAYYAHMIQQRHRFNPLLHGQNLFQQFVVDCHVRIEQMALLYYRTHQADIRAEEHSVLRDYVQGGNDGVAPGRRVILPSSFTRGPRAMQQDYQDAMAIVVNCGKPDAFVTMTCNPKWPEIVENLGEGQVTADRPDLVARVFERKVKALMARLREKKGVLGEVLAFVYVYEWQKRGLPHVHILLTMTDSTKWRTVDDIDKMVCAEIPDRTEDGQLYEIVTKNMVHRVCGVSNPSAPCMKDDFVSKGYPKPYVQSTYCDGNAYPHYRRRNDGRQVIINGNIYTNQHIVPYNPALSKYMNCRGVL